MASLSDHYGTLGVESGTDEASIKKAYRKLVLLWHPDKHPADREEAEVKIRQINDAYETLSNPFKRQQYDQQRTAFERKARGVQLNTAGIKPRMAIPKEFMLSPMGHPAKFVRCVGTSAFVQSRADVTSEFKDFFSVAKFSLWWLPEINNMCRVRVSATVSEGYGGGVNFNFNLSPSVPTSEVILSAVEDRDTSALIAVASPSFEGCFRFESACYPGHYLAFKPPTHLRIMGGVAEETTTIDFMLVDFSQMFRFITMEEVLTPAVFGLGGAVNSVPLDMVRADNNIQMYFAKVVQRPIWSDEDFATFFESRSDNFDYDADSRVVRLRTKQEQLANSLQRARGPIELAATISRATISRAGEDLLTLLPLDTFVVLLDSLGPPPPSEGGASAVVNHMDAQKKILAALPELCRKKEPRFDRLLDFHTRVAKFGGEQPEAKIAERRKETAKELGTLVSQHMVKHGLVDQLTFEILGSLCEMPLDWSICGEVLEKAAPGLLQERSLEVLVPLLRGVVKSSTGALVELLGNRVWELLPDAAAPAAAEVLEIMAVGGLRLDELPKALIRVERLGAPFPAVVAVVAALGERSTEADEMRACAAFVAEAPRTALEELPPAMLLRIMVAATKSAVVAEVALDPVAGAISVILHNFSMDDTSKLLLAAAKAKGGAGGGEGMTSLYSRAADVVGPKLKDLSVVQLIKIVLAVGKASACRPLLEAAGFLAAGQFASLSQSHLLLLVQGLLPLGASHPAFVRILELLISAFSEATRKENLYGSGDVVIDRRRELETQGQLTADHIGKLAQTLAPAVPGNNGFWEALGNRISEMPKSLTSSGHTALEAAFPDGAGPDFESKSRMLRKVADALAAKERGARDAVEMTTREKAYHKQKDYEKREAERKSQMDKEAEADEKERKRERAKALERAGGGKGREPSRSRRGKDRSRSPSRSDRKDKDKDKKKEAKKKRSRTRSPKKRSRTRSPKKRSRSRSPKKRSRSRDRDRDRRR